MKCKDCSFYSTFFRGSGVCKSPKIKDLSDSMQQYPNEDELAFTDCEGMGASFLVGKDFGCIHFVKRGS